MNITGVLIGLYSAVNLAFLGFVASANNTQTGQLTDHETRISKTEVRLERIPILEAKIDKLLEKQGVNPDMIESRYDLSTSSQARR